MLGERRPADLKGLAARFACSAAAGAEAAHFDENDELLAGQFRDGEFVGEPESPLNPETTEEEERELRRLGEESLQPGTAAHAVAVQISQLIERFIYVDSRPFRFVTDYRGARHNREYLKPLYDLCEEFPKGSRNIVLHTGRQVEKCEYSENTVLMADGSWKRAADVQIGDVVVTVNEKTFETAARPITWKSQPRKKPAVRVRTRQGHEAIFGHEHPLFRSGAWTPAEQVQTADRLGVVRRIAMPDAPVAVERELLTARLLGWMVSEGSMGSNNWIFTNHSAAVRDDFERALRICVPGVQPHLQLRDGKAVGLTVPAIARDFLRQYLPVRVLSAGERVPQWIYQQGPLVRAEFLNRLWGGDGHVSIQSRAKYEISYCSVSRRLCRDVQALLWGFGIPTSIRSFKPTLYKGTDEVAWQIRVETQDGVNRFLRDVGAFGKTDGVEPIVAESNNNRDTIPKDAAQTVVDRIYGKRRSRNAASTLCRQGLRRKFKFAPTREKFAQYLTVLGAEADADALRWLSTDIFWDEVESVERLPAEDCVDFTVEADHNFIVEGFITHNSTTQAAKSIVLGTMMPSFKSLYVAPRFDQVSIFSNQRFKPMAEDGPNLKPFIRPSKTEWKVGSKTFLNRSSYNFRSCYMTADNCRGISAHHLMLDELQDLLSDNINVLEQCQSHYGWDTGLCFRTYAGTPKTNNNPLSRRYQQSSQFEYLIRCMACNHWNYPDENIIGPTCYICTRCGREIFPHRDGKWEPMNKAALPEMWGFRIPQIVVPFKNHSDVHRDMTSPNISRLTFHNEVLGLPYDEGELVLTDGDMQRACEPGVPMWTIEQIGLYARQGKPIFGGVDYGTGEGQSPSFTVLALGHFDEHDVFHVRYLQRFTGKLAALAPQPALISRLATGAGCRFMFADWGFGAHQNARLVAEFGWDWLNGAHVLAQVMYVGQRRLATFDNQLFIYKVDRNQSMIAHIDSIKQGRTKFFRAEEMQPFFADHTTIYTEYNETYGTTKYDHVEPDDAFHAVHYARMAGLQYYGKLTPQALPDVTKLDLDDLGY